MNCVESKTTLDRHPLGQGFLVFVDGLMHGPGDRHGVGAPLLSHHHALGLDAIDPGQPPDVLEPVFDEGHVADIDRAAAHLADDDLAERVQVEGLAQHPDIHLPAGGFQPAGRQFDMLPLEGRGDVHHRQAFFIQLRGVQPDPDIPVQGAHE